MTNSPLEREGKMRKILGSLLFGTFLLTTQAAQALDALVTAPLNFRDGPSTAYAIRGTIPPGEIVGVRGCSGNWCEINYGPRIGWASASYLAFRNGEAVYNSYNRPSPTYNVIIGGGYFDDDDDWYYRHYRRHHWHGDHRPPPPPPPHWGFDRPHRPPPGMRPPPFRPGPGMPPPPPHGGPGGHYPGSRPGGHFPAGGPGGGSGGPGFPPPSHGGSGGGFPDIKPGGGRPATPPPSHGGGFPDIRPGGGAPGGGFGEDFPDIKR